MLSDYRKHPFHDELVEAGHELRKDKDGEVDIFVLEYGYHNGPGCIKCGESWCQHCGGKVKPCPREVIDAQ